MRFILSLLILIFCSCGSDNIGDCFESQGDPVEVSYELPPFTKLRSESDVIVYLKQGPAQKVVLKTGENMLSDAQIEVLDGGILRLKNNKRCNLVRDYENFIVYVTTPNLTEIRNASGQDIIGEGVLEFSTLRLVSDTSFDAEGGPARKSGNFYLELETENLTVQANGKSVFYLSGSAESFRANFPNEGPRLESRELIAQNIVISQTSANKMIVNPQASIKGTIFGTGDVISANRPPVVEVEQLYTGRLIFEE
ncbi:head GIN domain-containing protein [Leeuwenhoekiella sp. MAR_2009_132]|uniref:head GIN domain-containing protein n=1 Tax=Leeuwenhoekiella sp. MAR_2009_132 TaxID=1392489 RepID=UPI00048DA0C4|nr:head GIN domain-containing protein [Leeuwenhoekiella sp. MAR_2009_132]